MSRAVGASAVKGALRDGLRVRGVGDFGDLAHFSENGERFRYAVLSRQRCGMSKVMPDDFVMERLWLRIVVPCVFIGVLAMWFLVGWSASVLWGVMFVAGTVEVGPGFMREFKGVLGRNHHSDDSSNDLDRDGEHTQCRSTPPSLLPISRVDF